MCSSDLNQASVIVRDMLPITIIYWHKPKDTDDEASYVREHKKDLLYDTLMIHFNLPEGKKEKVKE